MTHVAYSLVELRIIFDAIQEKLVTEMTSHSMGLPTAKVIIVCKPKIRIHDLTSIYISETRVVLGNPEHIEFYGISHKTHLLSDALVSSLSYF